jgi:hypothetical protein
MNISEVNALLQTPLFTVPVTESIQDQDYEFYPTHRIVTMFTARFQFSVHL